MIYSLDQLKQIILPILQSMPIGDEDRVADAIVKIIEEDRVANKPSGEVTDGTAG